MSRSEEAAPWATVKGWLAQALAQPAAQRAAWLAALRASGEVPAAVLDELASLLAHLPAEDETDADRWGTPLWAGLDVQALDEDCPPDADDTLLRPGERLGPWEVLGLLGRGGMAEVMLARRADGAWEGEAAIKVLRRGMDSAAILARFALEQRALGRLVHPHIARLLDAGRTALGQPYFVMERVQGLPIDRACAGRSLAQRLDLFLQLADAVAFAHRQLLVHRDLKPSNVLVTPEGQVKLLDFGIAKALEPGPADAGLTQTGPRPFTPHYASPEQVRGEPIGTATDIYSLGVLLYVLLTGLRPTGRGATTPQQAVRSVLEETPTRPSALSPQEVGDPQWLQTRRHLRGDLDNILLKTLEKAPERRYPSVEALAADVRAYRDGYPVSARAPGWRYRAAKFVGRHRVPVALASLALVSLCGGLGAALWQGQQARQARDEARAQLAALKGITTELVFRYGDTTTTLPGGPQAQEAMLRETLAQLESLSRQLPGDRDLQALIASTLGRLAELQGNQTLAAPERADEARATVARALTLGEALWESHGRDWRFAVWHGRTLAIRAQLDRLRGEPAQGVVALQTSIARLGQTLATETSMPGRAHLLAVRSGALLLRAQLHDQVTLASLNQPQAALRDYALAEQDLRAMLADHTMLAELDRQAVPGDPATEVYLRHQLGTVLGGRALVHLRLEDLPAMRREAEDALALRQANVAREPRNLGWRDGLMVEANTLSIALIRLGEAGPALEAARLAWDTAATLAREQGPTSKWAGAPPFLAPQWGRALALNGRHAEALPVYDQAMALWSARLAQGANPNAQRRLAWVGVLKARSLAALGRREAAAALAQRAVQALQPLQDHPEQGRDALLASAEGSALLAQLQPAQAAVWRQQGLLALARAQTLRPLAEDHRALRQKLSEGGSRAPHRS